MKKFGEWITNSRIADGTIAEAKLDTNAIQGLEPMNLQPEGAQNGLAADSTGIKYEGDRHRYLDPELLADVKKAYIEVSKASSAGDEVTAIEIYDDTAAAVADSMSVTGGASRSRSAGILASLTEGNEIHVRWNVTTSSPTTGATFDAESISLIFVLGAS